MVAHLETDKNQEERGDKKEKKKGEKNLNETKNIATSRGAPTAIPKQRSSELVIVASHISPWPPASSVRGESAFLKRREGLKNLKKRTRNIAMGREGVKTNQSNNRDRLPLFHTK